MSTARVYARRQCCIHGREDGTPAYRLLGLIGCTVVKVSTKRAQGSVDLVSLVEYNPCASDLRKYTQAAKISIRAWGKGLLFSAGVLFRGGARSANASVSLRTPRKILVTRFL